MLRLVEYVDETCNTACINKDSTMCKPSGFEIGSMRMFVAVSLLMNRCTTDGTVTLALIVNEMFCV